MSIRSNHMTLYWSDVIHCSSLFAALHSTRICHRHLTPHLPRKDSTIRSRDLCAVMWNIRNHSTVTWRHSSPGVTCPINADRVIVGSVIRALENERVELSSLSRSVEHENIRLLRHGKLPVTRKHSRGTDCAVLLLILPLNGYPAGISNN